MVILLYRKQTGYISFRLYTLSCLLKLPTSCSAFQRSRDSAPSPLLNLSFGATFPVISPSRSIPAHLSNRDSKVFICSLYFASNGRPGVSDVSPLSGTSGLSFDSTLLLPLLFLYRGMSLFLFYFYSACWPFLLTPPPPHENSSTFFLRR